MRNGILSGYRYPDGSFGIRGLYAYFWSSSGAGMSAWSRTLYYSTATELRDTNKKSYGFSAIYKVKED